MTLSHAPLRWQRCWRNSLALVKHWCSLPWACRSTAPLPAGTFMDEMCYHATMYAGLRSEPRQRMMGNCVIPRRAARRVSRCVSLATTQGPATRRGPARRAARRVLRKGARRQNCAVRRYSARRRVCGCVWVIGRCGLGCPDVSKGASCPKQAPAGVAGALSVSQGSAHRSEAHQSPAPGAPRARRVGVRVWGHHIYGVIPCYCAAAAAPGRARPQERGGSRARGAARAAAAARALKIAARGRRCSAN